LESVIMDTLKHADEHCTSLIQRLRLGPLDYVVYPGATLFGYKGIGPSLIFVYLASGLSALYLALLSLALGQVINRGMKVMLQRTRPVASDAPPRALSVFIPGPDHGDGASFPSGDTMAGAAVGAVLALSGAGSGWWALGLYAGFARVYFLCHFVLDCVAGFVVGAGAVKAVAALSSNGQRLLLWHVLVCVPPFIISMDLLKRVQTSYAAKLKR